MKIRWFIVDGEPPAVDELPYILIHFEVAATAGPASNVMDVIKKYHEAVSKLGFSFEIKTRPRVNPQAYSSMSGT